jgi:hypothetical protein
MRTTSLGGNVREGRDEGGESEKKLVVSRVKCSVWDVRCGRCRWDDNAAVEGEIGWHRVLSSIVLVHFAPSSHVTSGPYLQSTVQSFATPSITHRNAEHPRFSVYSRDLMLVIIVDSLEG